MIQIKNSNLLNAGPVEEIIETVKPVIGKDSLTGVFSVYLDTGDGMYIPMNPAEVKSLINNLQSSLAELAVSTLEEKEQTIP